MKINLCSGCVTSVGFTGGYATSVEIACNISIVYIQPPWRLYLCNFHTKVLVIVKKGTLWEMKRSNFLM